ncbi:hypothetical protein C8F01DRAFT_1082535 [Mycena amicta]|nr:hypothetical protein C8F01DRAFT_1082535 [Mycena amicta]
MSPEELARLFGLVIRPRKNLNYRHLDFLRKVVEIYSFQELFNMFGNPNSLRMRMGLASRSANLGIIDKSYKSNGILVRLESPPLEPAVRNALIAYCESRDAYFKKRGSECVVRERNARAIFQAGEQAWHDFIVPWLAARGRVRPSWALEPLPGMRCVHTQPVHQPVRRSLGVIDLTRDVIDLTGEDRGSKKRRAGEVIDLTRTTKKGRSGVIDLTRQRRGLLVRVPRSIPDADHPSPVSRRVKTKVDVARGSALPATKTEGCKGTNARRECGDDEGKMAVVLLKMAVVLLKKSVRPSVQRFHALPQRQGNPPAQMQSVWPTESQAEADTKSSRHSRSLELVCSLRASW